MNSIGLLISHKNNEKRRAIIPDDIKKMKYPNYLFIEKGYGDAIGINDEEYKRAGANIVSREQAMKCDIISDVKLGDADYLQSIENGKVLVGWAHAAQGIDFTNTCIDKKFTVYAWEEMYKEGRYIFYKNRIIAGEAAILQAFCNYGKMPYECKVAIIGNGKTAQGAIRILNGLGADVTIYNRELETLFHKEKYNYDVIVNCVLWDLDRKDHLISYGDLKKMKKGSMIIDVSCDPHLGIESSHATTITNPVYTEDGIIHYCVDNTPAMFPVTVTNILSSQNSMIFDMFINDDFSQFINEAIVIKDGIVTNKEVKEFRLSKGLPCE